MSMATDFKELFQDVSFVLKFIVLIILVAATAISASHQSLVSTVEKGTGELLRVAVYTHIIILLGLLAVYIFAEPHVVYNLVYLILGGILNLTLGILCLVGWAGRSKRDSDAKATRTVVVGALAMCAGIIMMLDVIILIMKI